MKLNRLTISNFLRVSAADVDLSGSALHCFAGPNEAGKTTLAESIRFALCGDTPRVDLKKDYGTLVTDGASKGFVSVDIDGIVIKRDVSTGKADLDVTGTMSAAAITALRIALGAQSFVHMKPNERRQMMFDVVGISMGPDEVGKRLVEKGLSEAFVNKTLKPLLKASVDAALTHAKSQQREVRAQWEAVTKDKFGSDKATAWKAAVPKPPNKAAAEIKDLLAAKQTTDALDNECQAMAKGVGKLEGEVETRRSYDVQLQRLDGLVQNKEQITKDHEVAKAEVERLKDLITTEQDMIERYQRAAVVRLSCPNCSTSLRISEENELEFAPESDAEFEDEKGMTVEKRRANLAKLESQQEGAKALLKTASDRVNAIAEQARLRNGLIERQTPLATEGQLQQAEQNLAAKRQQLMIDRETLAEATKYHNDLANAATTTKHAGEIFAAWQAWTRTAELLAPNGVPGDILNEAMEKVNRRLAASADLAGWGAPSITEEMEIVRLGRGDDLELPFQMLSESAQWRVSAVIAEVISTLAGVKLLVLDRWDVLDMDGRAQFIKWAKMLASDSFDTILTFATLRKQNGAAPKIDGFEVHWVEGGVVS